MKEIFWICVIIVVCTFIVCGIWNLMDITEVDRLRTTAITAGAARWTVNEKTGERRLEWCTCFKGEENADE